MYTFLIVPDAIKNKKANHRPGRRYQTKDFYSEYVKTDNQVINSSSNSLKTIINLIIPWKD